METVTKKNGNSLLVYFVAAHLLTLFGYTFNHGLFIHPAQILLLAAGLLVLILSLFKKQWLVFNISPSPLKLLLFANLVSFVLFYFMDNPIYLVSRQAFNNILWLQFFSLILFFFYLIKFNFQGNNFFSALIIHLAKSKFVYLVITALILRLLVIFYSPAPKIDVFWLLDGGVDSIVRGENPYSATFVNIYSPQDCQALYSKSECFNDNYSYLPAVIFATAFFKGIFGDVRFTYVFAVFGSAAIIYFLLKKKYARFLELPELATLLILYLPLGLFVLEQSWVDPLSIFLLYLFFFLLEANYNYWPYVVFGILLATKQNMLVFLPFLFKIPEISFKKVFAAAGTFLLFILPSAVWNFKDFIFDVIIDQLQFIEGLHSLSLMTLSRVYFHQNLPWLLILVLSLSLFIFLFLKTKPGLVGFLRAALIFMFAVFFLKRGFANYYYFISALNIFLIVLELYDNNDNNSEKFVN
ncbi:MAG: hypothetical protein WCX08_05910 [Candidatus Buchananbacteria bacterium]